MNITDVKKLVKEIEETPGDDEIAHSCEDALYSDLLQSIADGSCDDPAGCAREALKTAEIDFHRWYA